MSLTDVQGILNLVVAAVLMVLGWLARELWNAVKNLKEDLHQIEIDLPSKYISKDEYHDSMIEIRELCKRIFDKIDALEQRKADK